MCLEVIICMLLLLIFHSVFCIFSWKIATSESFALQMVPEHFG
uniref:Uncharacterized protein n=1 Tax=Arundo donax TaxID=35708 RepID=A0A0A9ACQ0_ARUDO